MNPKIFIKLLKEKLKANKPSNQLIEVSVNAKHKKDETKTLQNFGMQVDFITTQKRKPVFNYSLYHIGNEELCINNTKFPSIVCNCKPRSKSSLYRRRNIIQTLLRSRKRSFNRKHSCEYMNNGDKLNYTCEQDYNFIRNKTPEQRTMPIQSRTFLHSRTQCYSPLISKCCNVKLAYKRYK